MVKQLFWLMLGSFAIGTEGFVIAGILPDMSRDLHVSLAQAGQLVVLFSLTYGVAAPVCAALTAGWPRERVLRLAMGGFVLGNVAAALAGGFAGLAFARVALAVCAGLYMGTAGAYAAASVEPARRGRAMSLLYFGMNAATIIGVPLGTMVGHWFGWRATFAMVGGIALLAWAGLCLPRPAQPLQAVPSLRERLRIATRPDVMQGLATTLFCFAGIFAMYTYLAPLLGTIAGLPEQGIALVLLLFGVAGSVGNLLGGQLADRFGPMRVITGALLLLSMVYAGMALTAHFASPDTAAWLAVVLVGAWGVIGWSFAPAQQLAFVRRAPEAVSVVLSLNASALYFGISLGAWLGSLTVAAGAVRSLGVVGAACVLLALAIARWPRRAAQVVVAPAR